MDAQLRAFLEEFNSSPDLHVFRNVPQEDDFTFVSDAEPKTHHARLIEQPEIGMQQHPVPQADVSGFTHFVDGIQRSRPVFSFQYVHVVRGYTAACIRMRAEDRTMTRAGDYFESSDALYFPYSLLDRSPLARHSLPTRDSSPRNKTDEEVSDQPEAVRKYAKDAINHDRENLEKKLTLRWIDGESQGRWLLVDGGLSGAFNIDSHPRVVGVIKSHMTRYFSGADHRCILQLPPEHRSSVFQPNTGAYLPVYSWYLRLRPYSGEDLAFGLVRVEAAATDDTVAMADTISSWLLAERCPVSLPDSRWDRMFYPIWECEQYLKATAPSKTSIEAMLLSS